MLMFGYIATASTVKSLEPGGKGKRFLSSHQDLLGIWGMSQNEVVCLLEAVIHPYEGWPEYRIFCVNDCSRG